MSDNYAAETRPLFKLLRNPAFRFIIIRYNHHDLIRRLVNDLRSLFPDRPLLQINTAETHYEALTAAYFGIENGFVLLDRFEDALTESRDSRGNETPQMQANNERRRGITAGLNLRRDKLAQVPNALILLVPAHDQVLYGKAIMAKMPDLWSFRSLMVDLEQAVEVGRQLQPQTRSITSPPILTETARASQEAELSRLLDLVEKTPKEETSYLATLWPQIAAIQEELGHYEAAFVSLEAWEQIAEEKDKGLIWLRQGEVLELQGRLTASMERFVQAKEFFEANNDRYNLAVSYERIGDLHQAQGNYAEALKYFGNFTRLTEELYASNPQSEDLKNGLAISYSKLGSLHQAQGNYAEALKYFTDYNSLREELYASNPRSYDLYRDLGVSYLDLAGLYKKMGKDPEAVRKGYEKALNIFTELYAWAGLPEAKRLMESAREQLDTLG